MKFLRSNWLLILLALTATILGLGKLYLSTRPVQAPVYENSWNGITPGQSSLDEVAGKFGAPVSTEKKDGATILNYQSEVGDLKNQIYSEGNKVGLVKEQVWGKENLSDYKNKYGSPQAEYFGDYAQSGYKVYLYTTQGLAVIAHTEDGYVLEKWYFQPVSLAEFLGTWGKDLKTEPEARF